MCQSPRAPFGSPVHLPSSEGGAHSRGPSDEATSFSEDGPPTIDHVQDTLTMIPGRGSGSKPGLGPLPTWLGSRTTRSSEGRRSLGNPSLSIRQRGHGGGASGTRGPLAHPLVARRVYRSYWAPGGTRPPHRLSGRDPFASPTGAPGLEGREDPTRPLALPVSAWTRPQPVAWHRADRRTGHRVPYCLESVR